MLSPLVTRNEVSTGYQGRGLGNVIKRLKAYQDLSRGDKTVLFGLNTNLDLLWNYRRGL